MTRTLASLSIVGLIIYWARAYFSITAFKLSPLLKTIQQNSSCGRSRTNFWPSASSLLKIGRLLFDSGLRYKNIYSEAKCSNGSCVYDRYEIFSELPYFPRSHSSVKTDEYCLFSFLATPLHASEDIIGQSVI